MRNRKRMIATIVVVAISVAMMPTVVWQPYAAGSETYPDIGEEPAQIQEAIAYVTDMEYMNGAADGNFYPREPVGRLDYARALVRIFGNEDDELDSHISFSDLEDSSDGFRYANLAVKHGYLQTRSNGSFAPNEPVETAEALTGLVVGLEMEQPVEYLEGLYPGAPEYAPHLVIAHDLHLKYRDTRSRPSDEYPRGEMAFSLERMTGLETWRLEYVNDAFDWLHCQSPWVGPQRERALDSAFAKIGHPYVWGGDCDEENGYDCSGLVYFVMSRVLSYPFKRVADDQARDTRYPSVNRKELIAGDPIFFFSDATGDPSAYIGHAGLYIGQGLFIHSTGSNAGVSVDYLTGYWEEHFAWGKRVIDEPEPETFDTYILLMNPGEEDSTAELTYMMPGGRNYQEEVDLPSHSRKTVRVDDMLFNQEVSTTVTSPNGKVIAERSMYFRYRGLYPGGHDSPGIPSPAQQWYLPEGCTAHGFDTYILVQNPNPEQAGIKATYMDSEGSTLDHLFTVEPYSRFTVPVDVLPGMGDVEFSTSISADLPVVVERSMYFDYEGISEGHNSPGTTELRSDWYFAEGYTGGGFDSYILFMNPGDTKAEIILTLISPDGEREDVTFSMPAFSRRTVAVDKIAGWENREFSAEIRSPGVPVAVERAMYFEYKGIRGGHNALGNGGPGREWYLAEGYTAQDFDTYVLVVNPGSEDALVLARFMKNSGEYVDQYYEVPAYSRFTIPVDAIEGLSAAEVSTHLLSDKPVVVERSVYFKYGEVAGGTCAPGVRNASGSWYFAEGYTGI